MCVLLFCLGFYQIVLDQIGVTETCVFARQPLDAERFLRGKLLEIAGLDEIMTVVQDQNVAGADGRDEAA